MAYVRKVRTASGATAVQIAEYRDGRDRVLEHLGSAHTLRNCLPLSSRRDGSLRRCRTSWTFCHRLRSRGR
ncbi:hypothetical protein D9T14_09605 [Propionibacterium australiense]|uniref:Uncharacterized protein n=1 Tax=Propionibacterium australiense TaxID=119981 RepID=A0A8B3FJV1_9ACTN|nr:hypothetical protein D7U36_11580 [Propionibacterium australiense]RLP08132.1 hypothetical protein D9T14_09605 [Propionibacterium australiense]